MHARGMSVRATARAAGYSDHTLVSKVLSGHKPIILSLAYDSTGRSPQTGKSPPPPSQP